MKRFSNLLIFTSLIALSSCTFKDPYALGFEYDYSLERLEIAYRVEKLDFNKDEDVIVYVSYGHYHGDNKPVYNDKTLILNVCLFLDYGNDEYDNSKPENYVNFNGYLFLDEVEIEKFYTDDYEYRETRRSKEFAYEKEVIIPYSYFEDEHSHCFSFHAYQMLYDNEEKRLTHSAFAFIDFYFSFNEDSGNIKILFYK